MKRIKYRRKYFFLLFVIVITSCMFSVQCRKKNSSVDKRGHTNTENYTFTIVTTNDYVKNIVEIIGGSRISAYSLLHSGDKTYQYEPTQKDISLIKSSDLIFYSSLDLSPGLKRILKKHRIKKKSYDVVKGLDPKRFIKSSIYHSGYDPHIWFDPDIWQKVLLIVTKQLVELDPEFAINYKSNYIRYGQTVSFLNRYVKGWINRIPEKNRIMIIQDDVFEYLLNDYGFEIYSLKSVLSKDNEIDDEKLNNLVKKIIDKKVPVLFSEKYSENNFIERIQKELSRRQYKIKISDGLYTYSLGEKGTKEYFYIDAFRKDVDIIYNSLKSE